MAQQTVSRLRQLALASIDKSNLLPEQVPMLPVAVDEVLMATVQTSVPGTNRQGNPPFATKGK